MLTTDEKLLSELNIQPNVLLVVKTVLHLTSDDKGD
jgi:hypothetical protein